MSFLKLEGATIIYYHFIRSKFVKLIPTAKKKSNYSLSGKFSRIRKIVHSLWPFPSLIYLLLVSVFINVLFLL